MTPEEAAAYNSTAPHAAQARQCRECGLLGCILGDLMLNDKDFLIAALDWAIQDRRGLADAHWDCDKKTFKEIVRDIERLKRLRIKLTGSSQSDFEKYLNQCREVSIFDVRNMPPND